MSFLTHNQDEQDDLSLILLYKSSGELQYLGNLYERYMPLVYGVCLRYLEEESAKDAVMQVFEELVEKLKIHEVYHFKSWLHVLTRNHCLMLLREQKRKTGYLAPLDEAHFMENEDNMHHAGETSFENGMALEADLQAMEKCMKTLPEEQRRSVDLFYLKEKSYREIVVQTGYDLKKVKSYIQNGKRNLKICIEKQMHV